MPITHINTKMETGLEIYLPDRTTSKYGDTVTGGKAKVSETKMFDNTLHFKTEETENMWWNSDKVMPLQDELRAKHKDQRAKKYSDEYVRDGKIW